ncbi:MAG: phosphatidate cytidylyltransferase [Prevotella sp.]|jgi:phosphatidate cytidylyltransferase|nr:phosphatidate cytidylyltransferase [Prevotella sp.]MBR1411804.1 phosphatidate cytidylyltransferase [Prevotella sp.]
MNNFIVRTITGVIFVAAIVASFLRPETMVLLFSIVTGLTVWEFTGLVNERENVTVNRFICTVAGVYFFFAMTYFCSDLYGGAAKSVVFIPYLVTIIYLMIAELYLKQADPIQDWAYTMLSQMYIALPFSLLNVLAFTATTNGVVTFNTLLPLSIFIFLWVNDSGAYCVGSLLGRHKLFPRISPGKSWEGSIGGAVFVLLAAYAISYFLDGRMLNSLEWLGLGLVVVIFGTWGDLVESLFKRTLGIKDSGNILPGHGGMLDRFDSSLMAIPAAVVYLYTLSLF